MADREPGDWNRTHKIHPISRRQFGGLFIPRGDHQGPHRWYASVPSSQPDNSYVTSSVPRGSILGPLLFLVYINDLPQKIEYSQTYGYAVDYKLLSNNKHELQIDLQKLNEWCNNNEMRLHESKCKILCFKKKSLFTIKNETVNISSHQKDLGIQVCDNLTWHQNSKAPKLLKHFGTSEEIFTTELSLKLNYCYIVPIISYACQV